MIRIGYYLLDIKTIQNNNSSHYQRIIPNPSVRRPFDMILILNIVVKILVEAIKYSVDGVNERIRIWPQTLKVSRYDS
jgi:hypothetical protein